MAEPILIALGTRNRPAMLAEAIRSVLVQTDPDWRLVVADDGDGEPVERVVASEIPRDPRISFVRSDARSSGGAKNVAVAYGEREVLRGPASLIAFIDDDDLWLPGHLAACREALSQAPSAALVHGNAIDREAGVDSPYHRPKSGPFDGNVWPRMIRGLCMLPSTMVVRGGPYRAEGGFRGDLPNIQDMDLWLKILRQAPAAYVSEPLVIRRLHDGNISRDGLSRVYTMLVVYEQWWIKRATLSPADRRQVRRVLTDRCRRYVHRLMRDPAPTRAEIRKTAWSYLERYPSLDTFRGAFEAVFSSRRIKARPT